MKRGQFIKSTSALLLGSYIAPVFAKSFLKLRLNCLGYLLPLPIDMEIEKLLEKVSCGTSSKQVIIQTINKICYGKYAMSKLYKEHYVRIVKPIIGTKKLNGKGLYGDLYELKEKMSDELFFADTPIHHVQQASSFNVQKQFSSCNLCSLQNATNGENCSRVYVKHFDKRAAKQKGVFWVPESLAYVLYDPRYYIFGLPIEDPQRHIIKVENQREIHSKTGKYTRVSEFWTQKFFFQGDLASLEPLQKEYIIYWGHDEVLSKFYDIAPIKNCQESVSQFPGLPSIARQSVNN